MRHFFVMAVATIAATLLNPQVSLAERNWSSGKIVCSVGFWTAPVRDLSAGVKLAERDVATAIYRVDIKAKTAVKQDLKTSDLTRLTVYDVPLPKYFDGPTFGVIGERESSILQIDLESGRLVLHSMATNLLGLGNCAPDLAP